MQFQNRWKKVALTRNASWTGPYMRVTFDCNGSGCRKRWGWFVAIVVAVRFLVETAGEAHAQATFPSVYDSDDADSGTAPDPSATSAQPQTSSWSQLSKAWDSLQNQLSNHGVQFGIRYDGEGFVDMSGGLRRGATYLANFNLQLTVDAQRLVGWPGAFGNLWWAPQHFCWRCAGCQ
jgi:carbohydrate-selective porin OprB